MSLLNTVFKFIGDLVIKRWFQVSFKEDECVELYIGNVSGGGNLKYKFTLHKYNN